MSFPFSVRAAYALIVPGSMPIMTSSCMVESKGKDLEKLFGKRSRNIYKSQMLVLFSMKKSVVLFVLTILLCVSSALALQVSFDAVRAEVLPGENAMYTIHLHNEDPFAVTVTIKSIDLAWTMDKDSQSVVVNSGETKDIAVAYTPINPKNKPGTYGLNFQASTSQEKQVQLLPVQVIDYNELVSVKLPLMPIDPRRPAIINLDVRNMHGIALKEMRVQLESQLFNVQQNLELNAQERKTLEFPVKLAENQQEGNYDVNVRVFLGDRMIMDQKTPLRVSKYGAVQEVVEPAQNLFTYGEKITHTNNGNTVAEDVVEKEFGTLTYLFTKFNPEPTSVVESDGTRKVQWVNTLQPSAAVTIQYKTNYGKPLIYAILLLGIIVLVYNIRKQDVQIKKRVLMLHTEKGGVAIMKVLLVLRNASGHDLVGVTVVDKVPRMISAPSDFGSHKPESVKQVPDGVMIMWKIPHMRRGQEVMLSYKITSKMQLLGKITLPRAMAKAMMGARKYVGRSPSVTLKERKQF